MITRTDPVINPVINAVCHHWAAAWSLCHPPLPDRSRKCAWTSSRSSSWCRERGHRGGYRMSAAFSAAVPAGRIALWSGWSHTRRAWRNQHQSDSSNVSAALCRQWCCHCLLFLLRYISPCSPHLAAPCCWSPRRCSRPWLQRLCIPPAISVSPHQPLACKSLECFGPELGDVGIIVLRVI